MQSLISIAGATGTVTPAKTGGIAGQEANDMMTGSTEISFAAILQRGIATPAAAAVPGSASLPGGKDLPDTGKSAETALDILPGEPAETEMPHPLAEPVAGEILAEIPVVAAVVVSPRQSAPESGDIPTPTTEKARQAVPVPVPTKLALSDVSVLPNPVSEISQKPELPVIKVPVVPVTNPEERAARAAQFLPLQEEHRLPARETIQRRSASIGRADLLLVPQMAPVPSVSTSAFLPAEGTAPAMQISFANPGQIAAPIMQGSNLSAQQPRDFGALIDRLASSRDAAAPAGAGTVRIALPHAEFGAVTMRFDQSGGNLAIGVSSADPTFAPTVRAALAGELAQNDQPKDQTRDQPREQQRGQGQSADTAGGNSPNGQSQSRGNPEARGISQSPPTFARGEDARAEQFATEAQHARPANGRGLYI